MYKYILPCILVLLVYSSCFASDVGQFNVELFCLGRQECVTRELSAKDELANMRFSAENDRLVKMIINTAGYEGAVGYVKKMHIPHEDIVPPK